MDKQLKKVLLNTRRNFKKSAVIMEENFTEKELEKMKQDAINMPNFVEKLTIEVYNRLPKDTIIEPMILPAQYAVDGKLVEGELSVGGYQIVEMVNARTWKFNYTMPCSMFDQLGQDKAIPIIANKISQELNHNVSKMDVYRPFIMIEAMRAYKVTDEDQKKIDEGDWQYLAKVDKSKMYMRFRTRYGIIDDTNTD